MKEAVNGIKAKLAEKRMAREKSLKDYEIRITFAKNIRARDEDDAREIMLLELQQYELNGTFCNFDADYKINEIKK